MKIRWPIHALLVAILISLAVPSGCVRRRDTQRTLEMRGRSVEQAFDSHRDQLLSIPGVVGAGIARLDDKPLIVVMVRKRTPELMAMIPAQLDGYSIFIETIGDFEAHGDSQ